MDGVHDLGGREGFGPIPWRQGADSAPFHADWEPRAWALFLVFLRHGYPVWGLDWCRHVKERIGPLEYLSRNYFDLWTQTAMAITIEDGFASVQEYLDGRSTFEPAALPREIPTDSSLDNGPAFAVGSGVRVKHNLPDSHTRRPGYTRGRRGVVVAQAGRYPLADAGARGEILNEHLYSVAFDAAELWPEAEGRREKVYVDLWESYLERP